MGCDPDARETPITRPLTSPCAGHRSPPDGPRGFPGDRTCSRRAPLNLNAATEAQLEALPGIGPATATRIVEYRKKNGAFKKVEELMNVKGIGEKSFLKLKGLITVAPARAEA